MRYKVGDTVRMHKHWLRDGQEGQIIQFDDKLNRYLVNFADRFEGGGLDQCQLWLEDKDFETSSNK